MAEHIPEGQRTEEGQRLLAGDQTANYSTIEHHHHHHHHHGEPAKGGLSELAQIDADLSSCPYTLYKCWIIFAFICALIVVPLGIVGMVLEFKLLYVAGVVSGIWNIYQLHQERKAMSDLDLSRAEKALVSFKYYIIVVPLLYVILGIVDGEEWASIVFSALFNALFFYLLIFYGGQKVAEKLRRREELKRGSMV